jgi:hypothetical protein
VAQFRLMTWNVENLLRVGDQGGPTTQAELDAKLASLAQVIDAQQPDVLALQEIGPPDLLAALQQQLGHQFPHQEISAHPTSAASASPCSAACPSTTPSRSTRSPPGWHRSSTAMCPPTPTSRCQPWTTWAAARCRPPSPATATTSWSSPRT